jgi:hypothetical protein
MEFQFQPNEEDSLRSLAGGQAESNPDINSGEHFAKNPVERTAGAMGIACVEGLRIGQIEDWRGRYGSFGQCAGKIIGAKGGS